MQTESREANLQQIGSIRDLRSAADLLDFGFGLLVPWNSLGKWCVYPSVAENYGAAIAADHHDLNRRHHSKLS